MDAATWIWVSWTVARVVRLLLGIYRDSALLSLLIPLAVLVWGIVRTQMRKPC